MTTEQRPAAYTEPAAARSGDPSTRRRPSCAPRVASVNRGAARAAVLGVNDGLVTNVCLILAVAGASTGGRTCASPGSRA